MTIHQSAFDAGQGSPNLGAMQSNQDNFPPSVVSNIIKVAKTSIAISGGVTAAVIPVGAEIVAMAAHSNATFGGGTIRLRVGGGGANISDAVAMAVDNAVTMAASLDQFLKFVQANGVEFAPSAPDVTGDVYLFYKQG
jgi:hypothetical protein